MELYSDLSKYREPAYLTIVRNDLTVFDARDADILKLNRFTSWWNSVELTLVSAVKNPVHRDAITIDELLLEFSAEIRKRDEHARKRFLKAREPRMLRNRRHISSENSLERRANDRAC